MRQYGRTSKVIPNKWPVVYVWQRNHYSDVIMGAVVSQITNLTAVYSTVYSGADQRKHQSSASLAFVWGIHWWPVNSPHKWPVTRKMFPFDDVIMLFDGVFSIRVGVVAFSVLHILLIYKIHNALECGTWYHHPRRLQCVLSRNLRIFKVATWHYRCRHNLKK